MLTTFPSRQRRPLRTKQKGVVLLITLIMLVAMTLAAISLMRSVDTSNLVAGNMAFQQSSLHGADTGTEQAIAYLNSSLTGTTVNLRNGTTGAFTVNCGTLTCPVGYKSFYEPLLEPPTAGRTWDDFWNSMVTTVGVVALNGLPTGYSGNFVVEALCTSAAQTGCTTVTITSVTTTPQGQDMGGVSRNFSNTTNTTNAHYYRVTTKVDGPRNSVAYVQTILVW